MLRRRLVSVTTTPDLCQRQQSPPIAAVDIFNQPSNIRRNTSTSFAIWLSIDCNSSIFFTAWITVVWSRFPKRRPISGRDFEVSFSGRNRQVSHVRKSSPLYSTRDSSGGIGLGSSTPPPHSTKTHSHLTLTIASLSSLSSLSSPPFVAVAHRSPLCSEGMTKWETPLWSYFSLVGGMFIWF